jgi:hypothetical protein
LTEEFARCGSTSSADFPELVDADGVDSDRLSTDEAEGVDLFDIYVYRPEEGTGDWPEDIPHPAIFFAPGVGLNTVRTDPTDPEDHYYHYLFEPLAQAGFVVFAIQPSSRLGKRQAARSARVRNARVGGGGRGRIANPRCSWATAAAARRQRG